MERAHENQRREVEDMHREQWKDRHGIEVQRTDHDTAQHAHRQFSASRNGEECHGKTQLDAVISLQAREIENARNTPDFSKDDRGRG